MIGIICVAVLIMGVMRLYEGSAQYNFPADAYVLRYGQLYQCVLFILGYTYILWLSPFNELVLTGSDLKRELWYLALTSPIAIFHVRTKLYYLMFLDDGLRKRNGKNILNVNYEDIDVLKITREPKSKKCWKLDFCIKKPFLNISGGGDYFECTTIYFSYFSILYSILRGGEIVINLEEFVNFAETRCRLHDVKIETIYEEVPDNTAGGA